RLRAPQNRSTAQRVATEMQWQVVDPRTVKVTLPDVNFKVPTDLQTTFGMIGSPTAITERGADFVNNPVGAGPFTLGSWARGTEMTLVRNENYWDSPRPYLDELVVTVVPDEQQRVNAVVSGEIDVNSTQTQSSWEAGIDAGLVDNRTPYLTTGTGFRYNVRPDAQTANQGLRAAIARAIDTQAINDAVHAGAEAPKTLAMPTAFLYEAEPELPTEDLAEAQRLLDAYLAESGQSEVTVRYVYITGIPMISQEAQILKAQVERLNGINFELVALDSAARQTALRSGDFDLMYDAVGAWFDPDTLYARYHSNGSDNTSGISDPEVDAALVKTRSSEDPEVVTDGYVEALRLLTEKDVVVAWMTQEQAYLTRGNVGGLEPTYQYFPRAENLWITE
ncbi:ABC transporter substrate-binding protein, partial [Rhodococcus chondri]